MNVYEYSEYLNHKDRGIKYPEYREDVPSRMSSPSKKVAGSDVVTPQSSLLRESVQVDGGVLWSSRMFRLFITERKGNIHWNVPSRVEASKAALKQLPACYATRGKTEEPYDPHRTTTQRDGDPSVLNLVQIPS